MKLPNKHRADVSPICRSVCGALSLATLVLMEHPPAGNIEKQKLSHHRLGTPGSQERRGR